MAERVVTTVTCDACSESEDTQTERFGVQGKSYVIDLCPVHADQFRDELLRWAEIARPDRPSKPARGSSVDVKAVRAWARANGVEVSERGRIKASIIEQYKAAA